MSQDKYETEQKPSPIEVTAIELFVVNSLLSVNARLSRIEAAMDGVMIDGDRAHQEAVEALGREIGNIEAMPDAAPGSSKLRVLMAAISQSLPSQ